MRLFIFSGRRACVDSFSQPWLHQTFLRPDKEKWGTGDETRRNLTSQTKEVKMTTKKFLPMMMALVIVILLTGCNNPRAQEPSKWYLPWTWGDKTLKQSLEEGCQGGALTTNIGGSTYPCLGYATAPSQSTPAAQPLSTSSSDPLYNLPPQPQIGHPSVYLETGVPCQNIPQGMKCNDVDEHTKHWVIQLLPGTTAIIGGFTVDGVTNGVYKAQAGPGTLDVIVTDGFVAITKNEWANAEFCFRIAQAVQFNWAHKTVLPLPGWSCP